MSQTIYVEGGGNGRELKVKCRKGFRTFFCKTALARQMPKIVACGSRQNTFKKFQIALARAANNDSIVMLVDSEAVARPGIGTRAHLHTCDKWDCPQELRKTTYILLSSAWNHGSWLIWTLWRTFLVRDSIVTSSLPVMMSKTSRYVI